MLMLVYKKDNNILLGSRSLASSIRKIMASVVILFSLLIGYALSVSAVRLLGTAACYNPQKNTSCDGYLRQVKGYVASASDDLWYNTTTCGKMYNLTCVDPLAADNMTYTCKSPSAFITVTIVDHCKRCAGSFGLSTDAFNQIATYDANSPVDKIKIYFAEVGDGLDSSIYSDVSHNFEAVYKSALPDYPPEPSIEVPNLTRITRSNFWSTLLDMPLGTFMIGLTIIVLIWYVLPKFRKAKLHDSITQGSGEANSSRDITEIGLSGGSTPVDLTRAGENIQDSGGTGSCRSVQVDTGENNSGDTREIELGSGGSFLVDAVTGGIIQDGVGTGSSGSASVDTRAEGNRQGSGGVRRRRYVPVDACANSSRDTGEITVTSGGSVSVDARTNSSRDTGEITLQSGGSILVDTGVSSSGDTREIELGSGGFVLVDAGVEEIIHDGGGMESSRSVPVDTRTEGNKQGIRAGANSYRDTEEITVPSRVSVSVDVQVSIFRDTREITVQSGGSAPVDVRALDTRQDRGRTRSGVSVPVDAQASIFRDTREITVQSGGSAPVDVRALDTRQDSGPMRSGTDNFSEIVVSNDSGKQVREIIESRNLKEYSYSDISEMTNSLTNLLGKGAFGIVYKGKLLDNKEVAVKVLVSSNGTDFVAEVRSISRTSHRNCIKLLGYCVDQRNALVYEFMTKGSLKDFIHVRDTRAAFEAFGWEDRFKVAVGIAQGLRYLHTDCEPQILHLDIKPHNILLDEKFEPKLADFGLARVCNRDGPSISTERLQGTYGYFAPELLQGKISPAADVYSYGILLIEMIGGRNNNISPKDTYSETLYNFIYVTRKIKHLVFNGCTTLDEKKRAKNLGTKMAIVGLHCIQRNRHKRPTMSRVVEMLEGSLTELQSLPTPDHPLWNRTPSSCIVQ